MELEYTCRYCQNSLGHIHGDDFTERQLGFDQLTLKEREDIITINVNGVYQVRVICETCQDILDTYPERSILPHLLQ